MINLQRFVDINILTSQISRVSSSRPTAVLITNAQDFDKVDAYYSSLEEVVSDLNPLLYDKVKKAFEVFFNNGGITLHFISRIDTTSESVNEIAKAIVKELNKLPLDEVVVSYIKLQSTYAFGAEAFLLAINTYNSRYYGIYSKIFVLDNNALIGTVPENCLIKYAMDDADIANRRSMATAAYLTKIDVSKINSIQDYCYTVENVQPQDISDNDYQNFVENGNYNINIYFANAVRNIGGSLVDGSDLVNAYCRIILQQSVTDRLVDLLSTKIKNNSGVAKIYNVISEELAKYVTCGYLTTDKIWDKEDLTIVYNNVEYTVIRKGQPLPKGYVTFIVPITGLSQSDKVAHKAPPVYLILAEQYSIRTITINGEVI